MKELSTINQRITALLQKNCEPELSEYKTYYKDLGGKYLRPLILLTVAKNLNPSNTKNTKDVLHAATAIELFHQMSLIHDDIIDRSPKRRNKKTAYTRYGENKAIVFGDLLFSIATEELSLCQNKNVRKEISKAISAVCKGQLLQMKLRNRSCVTEKEYFLIVSLKTAPLFSAAAASGAFISGNKNVSMARKFGNNLGIAFQIIDDIEDITGDSRTTGKPRGQDLREGETTLPIHYLMNEVTTLEKTMIQKTLKSSSSKNIGKIIKLYENSKAQIQSSKKSSAYLEKATKNISTFPNNRSKKQLEDLINKLKQKLYR